MHDIAFFGVRRKFSGGNVFRHGSTAGIVWQANDRTFFPRFVPRWQKKFPIA
jgi:hypothetical protein